MPPEPQLSAVWAARRCCDVPPVGAHASTADAGIPLAACPLG